VVDACIAGYNATIFAYGQTGSGKTFTMSGNGDAWGSSNEARGLIPRVMEHMFERIAAAKASDSSLECAVRASYLEVYNETLADLLDASGGQPVVREDMSRGVYVENLTEEPAETAVAVTSILQRGARNRHIGATSMNKESSRSHTVFTVTIQSKSSSGGLTKIKTSRLNLVDLAGSERQKAAQTEGQALKEASQINKSLSAIGNVSPTPLL
jgi:kinesin family protein 15